MAWIVTPTDVNTGAQPPQVLCVFDDGLGHAFKEWLPFAGTESLKAAVKRRIGQLTDTDDVIGALKPLLNTPLNLSAPVPPDPTEQDLFRLDVRALRRVSAAVSLGAMDVADKAYADLQAKVKTALANNPTWIDAF